MFPLGLRNNTATPRSASRARPPETLTDPVPGLVKYRVEEGDKLALLLHNGTAEWLAVSEVDGDFIRGKNDTSVAIDTIHKLEILPRSAAQDVTDAVIGLTAISLIAALSIAVASRTPRPAARA